MNCIHTRCIYWQDDDFSSLSVWDYRKVNCNEVLYMSLSFCAVCGQRHQSAKGFVWKPVAMRLLRLRKRVMNPRPGLVRGVGGLRRNQC